MNQNCTWEKDKASLFGKYQGKIAICVSPSDLVQHIESSIKGTNSHPDNDSRLYCKCKISCEGETIWPENQISAKNRLIEYLEFDSKCDTVNNLYRFG
jgi:hypothetical protein